MKVFSSNRLHWQQSQGRWRQGKTQKVTLTMHSKLIPAHLNEKNKTRQTKTNTMRPREYSYTQTFIHTGFCQHLLGVCKLLSSSAPLPHTSALSLTGLLVLPWPFTPLSWEFSWPLCISSSWVSIFPVSFVLNKYFSTRESHEKSCWTYQSNLIWPLTSLSRWYMLCSTDTLRLVWKCDNFPKSVRVSLRFLIFHKFSKLSKV